MLSILLFCWTQASGPPGAFEAFHRFGPQDVMRLAVQLRANLTCPHRILVITDLPAHEFCSGLEHVDLVQHFGELRQFGGCWLRLKCFSPELEPVIGPRWAWLDLDSLVVGNMDPLLDREEPLVLFKSDSIHGQNWNGSFVLGGPGSEDIWTNFDPTLAPLMVKQARAERNGLATRLGGPRGTDQAWLHLCRDLRTPHVSAVDGLLYWQLGRYPLLPSYARMITFAGPSKLSNWRVRRYSPWVDSFYPGDQIDPAGPLPHGQSIQPVELPKQIRKRGVVAMEREARRRAAGGRVKTHLGREFARA